MSCIKIRDATVTGMDLVKRDDYDSISWNTRMHLASKMHELMEQLQPYVDGSFGDVQPGHVQAYVRVAHELGALFQAHSRPYEKPEDKGVPAAKVQQMLETLAEQHEKQLQAAVAEAEVRTREQLQLELQAKERLSLEQGRSQILTALQQVSVRR